MVHETFTHTVAGIASCSWKSCLQVESCWLRFCWYMCQDYRISACTSIRWQQTKTWPLVLPLFQAGTVHLCSTSAWQSKGAGSPLVEGLVRVGIPVSSWRCCTLQLVLKENNFCQFSVVEQCILFYFLIVCIDAHWGTRISMLKAFSSSNIGDVRLSPGSSRGLLLFKVWNHLQGSEANVFNLNYVMMNFKKKKSFNGSLPSVILKYC